MPINIIKQENKFLDVEIPHLDLFSLKLTEINSQKIKYNKLDSEEFDFNIIINTEKVLPAKLNDLHEVMKVAFKLNWAPYNRTTKSYQYYTNRYQTIEQKKEQLKNIFSELVEFEKNYMVFKNESLIDFEEDSSANIEYKDADIHVKYIKDLDSFVILPLGFLGRDKYITIAKASKQTIELDKININNVMTDDLKVIKKNPNVFIIENLVYKSIKDYIEVIKKEKIEFLNQQTEIINNQNDIPHYNEKNIFNFKLELNRETNCFDFYCKGYNCNTDNYGNVIKRGLISNIALNYILSKKLEETDNKDDFLPDQEISRDNIAKYNLGLIKNNQFRLYTVPATKINILKEILNNFKKENAFFERPQKKFKVKSLYLDNYYMNTNNSYPSLFLDKDGKYYYVFNTRQTQKNEEHTTSFTAIELSKQEYQYFMTEHEWAEQIKINTVSLNCKIWYDKDVFQSLNASKVYDLFSNIEMRNNIITNTGEVKKEKKLKI